ncbi:hypothetical protein [Actinobacillus porcinus]|uniref:hypothetical protein n=1 Tax=Actinobacillus porcinus TaxID=51048 RepID=UPI0023EF69D1|nr:hypothetical protein [Actinobacillus porcinus]MDD7544517.1 hypothetical protein [Actinobacillus porcinus]MDY5847896.1 hypothetical protein [Actinobacillus porcinus]
MCKLRKFMYLAIGLGTSSVASAAVSEWVQLHLISPQNIGSSSTYITCTYELRSLFSNSNVGIEGEEISIRIRGSSCPYTIQYNPETNEWRR